MFIAGILGIPATRIIGNRSRGIHQVFRLAWTGSIAVGNEENLE